ncbi:MAG: helix-turn-helix transcriptional regulator [Burkholderiales bacterium]|nr:helix-turn-helix transcriptional regulator [Burkholderiales bacterium]
MTEEDHRTRVGAERRERMRRRLIESALHVFARKGVDATDIKDVAEQAQVSRGSFYNYFETNEELMAAVLEELGNELLVLVDTVVTQHDDPAERMALGLRMVLHTAQQHRLFARFVARVGIERAVGNSLAMNYVPRDIEAGVAAGRFHVNSLPAALTLVLGTAHAALCSMALNLPQPEDFPEEVVYQILLGLGMRRDAAHRLARLPLESVEPPAGALLNCFDPA